jgi:hypothetical protein
MQQTMLNYRNAATGSTHAVVGRHEIFNALQNKTAKTPDFFREMWIVVKTSESKHFASM